MQNAEGQVGNFDERRRVPDARVAPYSNICALHILRVGATQPVGATGWFIGPRTVVTAAHALWDYDQATPGWVQKVAVLPGHNGEAKGPFGVRYAEPGQFDTMPQWRNPKLTEQERDKYDVGVITLNEPFKVGPAAPFFQPVQYGSTTSPDARQDKSRFADASGMKGMRIASAGYPAEKQPSSSMWWQGGTIWAVDGVFLYYGLDPSKGQSGAPILRLDDDLVRGGGTVVGIHKGEWRPDPRAKAVGLRFNSAVMEQLAVWRGRDNSPPTKRMAEGLADAAPPREAEPPKEVEGAYVIKSEGSEVVHVLHDCPGIQNARHDIDTRRAGSLEDVAPVLREMGRPLCRICSERLTSDHREAVEAAVKAPPPEPEPAPAPPPEPEPAADPDVVHVEQASGELYVDRDTVHVWTREGDVTTTFPKERLRAVRTRSEPGPIIEMDYRTALYLGRQVHFACDDFDARDAIFAEISALLERHNPGGG